MHLDSKDFIPHSIGRRYVEYRCCTKAKFCLILILVDMFLRDVTRRLEALE